NTAVGYNALMSATIATHNTAIGYQNLNALTSGSQNIAVGSNILTALTVSANNIGIGHNVLTSNVSGGLNIGIGFNILTSSTSSNNIGIGNNALAASTTGQQNIAIGMGALDQLTTSSSNIGIGTNALGASTTGTGNTAIGGSTMFNNTTGGSNVAIGNSALLTNTTGSSLTCVGENANTGGAALGNSSAIGARAQVNTSNSMVLGSVNGVNGAVSNVFVGIATNSPAHILELGVNDAAKPTSSTWTVVSDERLKENIKDFNDGLDLVMQINPIWFTYNGEAGLPHETGVGTIAQELQKIAPYMITKWTYRESDTDQGMEYLGVDYGAMDFVLVNAIQELNNQVKQNSSAEEVAYNKQNNAIEQLQNENAALKKQLTEIEKQLNVLSDNMQASVAKK
ncbi:MAG TPA: tail fiber domain-containing protein, partial [Chitinophagales bacterium]|nr:tail fiber domain-containing protein [Chitinophagales bacterium]